MSIAYSFAKDGRSYSGNDSFDRNNSPGPDAYDAQKGMKIVKEQSPEWTFSRLNRPGVTPGGPGPGEYEADINRLKMNVSYSMGSKVVVQSPQKSSQNFHPGPGSYEPVLQQRPPTYTMGTKRKDLRPDGIPGPGTYDADDSLQRQSQRTGASPFMSKSKRETSLINYTSMSQTISSPGPGAYSPKAEYVKYQNPTFGIHKGRPITSRDLSPGPGAYDGNAKEMGKGLSNVTFKSRPKTAKQNEIPGPGQYDAQHKSINHNQKSQRGISSLMNKSERLMSISKSQMMSPGPGAYDANIDNVKDKTSKGNVGFGKTSRSGFVNKEDKLKPGPGNYEIKDNKGNKGFKIGQKPNTSYKNNVPGPGNYDPNPHVVKDSVRNMKISTTMSKSVLTSSKSQYIPGPGSYTTTNNEFGKNAKAVSIRGKPKDMQRNDSPGPGAYDPSDMLSKERSQTANMASGYRRDLYSTSNIHNPAPGQYQDTSQDFGKNVKSFTIKQRPVDKQGNEIPGPGHYDATDHLVKPITPGYKQSQSTRKDFVDQSEKAKPGPGQYTHGHKTIGKDVPSFSMGVKRQQRTELSPGPGEYEAAQTITKDSVRNFKMNTSKRPDIAPKTARDLPGPGAYDSPQKFGQDKPTFTIQSKRSEINRDKTPGPGSYDGMNNMLRDKSPSYRMGTGQRSQFVSKEVSNLPGPGIYDQKSNIGKGPQYTFKPRNEPRLNDLSPGPGIYEPNQNYVKDTVVSYKMSSKSKRTEMVSKEVYNMPGPGNYESPSKQSGPQFSMRGRSKSRQDLNPGPGEYDPKNFLSKDKTPSYAISKSMRQEMVAKSVSELPGPGQYTNNGKDFGKDTKSVKLNLLSLSLQFQIRGKPQEKVGNEVPGPGQYQQNNQVVKDRVISHKISQSQRQQIVTKEMLYQPGPGEYDSPKRFGQDAPSVTIRGRPEDNNRNDSPGPGNYNPDHGIVKDKIMTYKMASNSKRSELVSREQLSQPGPGIYDQQQHIGKDQKSYTIGTRPKDQQDNKIPGPGSYDPKDYLTRDQAQSSIKMSLTSRQQMVSKEMVERPGPGQYDSPQKIGGPNYTMGARSQSPIDTKPGPGQYDPNESFTKYQSPSFKINEKSQRTQMVSKEEMLKPGPGNYTQSKQFGEDAKSFQIRGKPQDKVGNEVPGPGNYDPNEHVVKHQNPTYKMNDKTQRTNIVNKEELQKPGPGVYTQGKQFGEDVKSFSIRGRPNEKVGNEVPGPGNYDPSSAQNKDRVLTYKIGTSNRVDIVNKEMMSSPGPGQYDSPSRYIGPNYTMGGRSESPQNDMPGPGHYDPNENIGKHQSPSFKINDKSQRTQMVSKEEMLKPGPGNYAQAKQFGEDAKSFQIRGKPQHRVGNEVPGPGNYDPNESIIKHQNPTYNMNDKTQRTNIVNKEELQKPGPGVYTQGKQFGEDVKSFSIRGKPNEKVGNEVPGPGNYDPSQSQNKDRVVAYKIGSSNRNDIVDRERTLSPGPGQYDSPNKPTGQTFSIGVRQDQSYNNNIPGPGQYDGNENVTKYTSPTYKMDSRTQRTNIVSNEKVSMPGPGIYDPPSSIGQGPSVQIRGKPSPERLSNVPGPGTYDANHNIVKDSTGQSQRMSTNKRDFLSVSKEFAQQPGPGQYDTKNLNHAPVYTIRGRDEINYDDGIPGPGTYDGNSSIMKHNNPSVNFGRSPDRSKQGSPSRDHQPGPGEYDNRDYNVGGNSVIVYSIPKAERQDPPNDTPGPGHYKLPAKFADVPSYSKIAQNEDFKWV